MGMMQRCEATLRVIVAQCRAGRLGVDEAVAMIEEVPAMSTVGPVLDVMAVDVAAVRATRQTASALALVVHA